MKLIPSIEARLVDEFWHHQGIVDEYNQQVRKHWKGEPMSLEMELKRIADRLEMIHNHLVKLPEKDPQLDAKLIKEEIAETPEPSKKKSVEKQEKPGTKAGKFEPKAEKLDEEFEEEDVEEEGVDELFEEEASDNGEMSLDELGDKCKKLLEAGKDKEHRAKIRGLFVEVLKNGFGKEKTSELKPSERKNFVATFEKRVKEKK